MKKSLLGVSALVLAFAASAFTTNVNRTTETWHFKNTSTIGDARVPGAYEAVTTPPQSCNSLPGKPCIISFDNSDVTTPDLAAYLATFSTDAAVTAAADVKRSN